MLLIHLLASSIKDKPFRAPLFRSNGVPPVCFLGRGQALSRTFVPIGQSPACLFPCAERTRMSPFTCLRSGRMESRLLASSVEDKPFRTPSFQLDGVLPACFLVPKGQGRAHSRAFVLDRRSPACLLPQSRTSLSARVGSPNCSVDNRQNVCSGWQP